MHRLFFAALLLLTLDVTRLQAQPETTPGAVTKPAVKGEDARKIIEAVFTPPFDEAKFQAYEAVLPKIGNYFIVEGDIRLSESELRGYVKAQLGAPKTDKPNPELTAMKNSDGSPAKYHSLEARQLTYAIDRQSFPDTESYELVKRNLQQAMKEWVDVCPECRITFTYISNLDGAVHGDLSARISDQVKFIIRRQSLGGKYIALAFFPQDPPVKKILQVDPVYFTPGLSADYLVGVFRHELGHVLGYRHEQVRDMKDCPPEEKPEDWISISIKPDALSVMHYHCGGGGTENLTFSETDKTSHRAWYALSSGSNAPSVSTSSESTAVAAPVVEKDADLATKAQVEAAHEPSTLVVRFEGADIAGNAAKVIKAFMDLGLIQKGSHAIDKDDSKGIEILYGKLLKLPTDLPLYSVSIRWLANEVNGTKVTERVLQPGEMIFYPQIEFDDYHYSKKYDLSVPAQRDEITTLRRSELLVRGNQATSQQASPDDEGRTKLRLIGYEIKVKIPTEELVDKAVLALNELTLKNIRWAINTPKKASYHSFENWLRRRDGTPITMQSARDFWDANSIAPSKVPVNTQGDLGALVGMPPLGRRPGEGNRAEVIIIDQPIFIHPNLADAFVNQNEEVPEKENPFRNSNAPLPPSVQDGFYTFGVGKFLKDSDHGTHLAGIVASRDNGFGIIGVNPRASLRAVNWEYFKDNQTALADRLEAMSHPLNEDASSTSLPQTPPPIFLFAAKWENKNPLPDPHGRPTDPRDKDVLADQIVQVEALWVVAAGNRTTEDPETEIGPGSNFPMNLGDKPMVLVITACEHCDNNNWSQAQIMLDAKVSSKFVHIAAPGDNIPSTVADGKFATAPGTSQAAALVAGVASAMVSARPLYYSKAFQVKKRLQITSRPFPFAADRGRIATGIIDAEMAMRDPQRNWFRPRGGDMATVDHFTWQVQDLPFTDPDTGHRVSAGKVEYIYRILKRNEEFYLYTKDEGARAPIWKVNLLGPYSVAAQDLETVIFKGEVSGPNGKTTMSFKLKEVEDLILAK